jgi:hypothetical protein
VVAPELAIVVIVSLVGAGALWAIPDGRGCPQCPHCLDEHAARELEQGELQHDVEHKGMGFANGDPDLFACSDEQCRRNIRQGRRGWKEAQPISRAARARRL